MSEEKTVTYEGHPEQLAPIKGKGSLTIIVETGFGPDPVVIPTGKASDILKAKGIVR